MKNVIVVTFALFSLSLLAQAENKKVPSRVPAQILGACPQSSTREAIISNLVAKGLRCENVGNSVFDPSSSVNVMMVKSGATIRNFRCSIEPTGAFARATEGTGLTRVYVRIFGLADWDSSAARMTSPANCQPGNSGEALLDVQLR